MGYSSNFTWHVDSLGDGAASTFYDIAIINDTLAYAVGGIYLLDSTGNFDPNAYNLAKWNGKTWSLIRIQYYTICGQANKSSFPASSIIATSPTDIWISCSDQIANWDGTKQTRTLCSPVSFPSAKLWAGGPNDIYMVGRGGEVVHYDGTNWQQLASPTSLWIRDIWGGVNPQTGAKEVYGIASNRFDVPSGKKLISIQGATVSSLSDSGLTFSLNGLWFIPGQKYYIAGDGLFEKDDIRSPGPWKQIHEGAITSFTEAIRGNGPNDIVVAGDYGMMVHYNGSTWRNYQSEAYIDGAYLAVAMKGSLVIAVGYTISGYNTRGALLIGRRQ